MELNLYITLQKPPAGLSYGLQKGSGNNYETIQTQRSGGGDLHFDLTIQIKGDPEKDAEPKPAGPFVQGPTGGKFLYIDIGAYAGQADGWSGRMKIPLSGISWVTLAEAGVILQTTVPGTAKNGTPNCATVKPFEGWKIK